MRLNRQEFEKLKIRDGRVLVKVDKIEPEKVGSVYIKAIATETVSAIAARCGVVIKTSAYTDIPVMNYAFKSKHEVEVGDVVWWSQNAVSNILKLKNKDVAEILVDDEIYLLIPYPELRVRLRNGEYIGLNDRIILRPTYPKISSIIILENTSLNERVCDEFEIAYVPTGEGEYSDHQKKISAKVGEVIKLAHKGRGVEKLEEDSLRKLPEELYAIRSSEIIATL